MAKKNHRRPSRRGRLKTGCISGLISFFDFRQGQIDRRKLLSDGRLSFKQSAADGRNSRDRGADEGSKNTEDPEEDEIPLTDMARTSVKELIEEELINDETVENLRNDSEIMKSSGVENDAAGCLLDGIGIIPDSKTPHKLDPGSRMENCEGFIDSVKILTSDDGLFLELLKESDSVLLKGIQNSMDSDGCRSRKPRNFFRRRSKTLESFPPEDYSDETPALNGAKCSETDVIDVISSSSWYGLNKPQNETSASSRFSFAEIKRRLWHAMGKETKVMAPDKMASPDHQMRRRNSGWSSPNRSHFYTERFTPSSSPGRKGVNQKLILDCEFDIYAEARKHLSELLRNSSEGSSDSVTGKLPKTLGGILSLPKKRDDAQNALRECCDRSKLEIQEEVAADIEEELSESSLKEGEISCESCNGSTDETTSCLKPGFSGEDHLFSSPTAAVGPGDFDLRGVDDKEGERPSPVSVLELVFVDDACSPGRSGASETVRDIRPLCMSFEDQHHQRSSSAKDRDPQLLCTRISTESEETPFEYVEAVLLGSGLDWNAFFARWLSSQPILDSTLFDEVEIFSSQPRCDQKLLFDSANEALQDAYFGYSSATTAAAAAAVSRAAPPRSEDVIEAIWNHVRWHLSRRTGHSLDQLVRMDLAGTDMWAKLDPAVEIVVFEVEEVVFGQMLDDTLNELGAV